MKQMRIVLKVFPSSKPELSLQLDQDKNNMYWLRGNKGGYSAEKVEIQLKTHEVVAALEDLAKAIVPVVPESVFGVNGITYKLEIYSGFNSVRYSWWGDPPEGYEALELFANKLIDWAEIEEHH